MSRLATLASTLTVLAVLALPGLAHAHPGHGIDAASHWHAGDTWGWLALAAIAVVAMALARRK